MEPLEPAHQLVSFSVDDVDELRTHQRGAEKSEGVLQLAADRVQIIHGLYTQNSDIINGALSAFGGLIESDLAKKSTLDVLGIAKKVTAALDCIEGVHPFVGVAVLAFKAVIQFEIQRRENDKRITGLIVQGSDLMITLLQLNEVPPDPKIVIPGHETIEGRLQSVLKKIHAKIKECGNAIDKYYKSRLLARFFKSSSWADRFKALADNFAQLKDDIANALAIRTAVQMGKAISTLEKTYALLLSKTEQEKQFEVEVRHRGGPDACLNRSSDLRDLDGKFSSTGTLKNEKVKAVGSIKPSGGDNKKDTALDATLIHDLHTPLDTLLKENEEIYEVMLEAQTNEIKDAIKSTESRLLHAFSAGAHTRVQDPHLRYIWRTMKWPLSVDTPYFIAAVYDYFAERFAQALATRDEPVAGDVSPRVPPTEFQAANDVDEEPPPPISLTEEWCLAYLDVYYVPALKEAFDDDANGLVNVREVNSFCNAHHLPSDWGILRRLAYAAAGWHTEMSLYSAMIQSCLNEIVYLQDDVLPGNRRTVNSYLNSDSVEYTKLLTRGLTVPPTTVELTDLAREKMQVHEKQLGEKLKAIAYEIPSDEFVPLWFGKGRVEQYLLPLIYILMKRHVEIVMFAKQELIDQRELSMGTWAIAHVINRAMDRVRYLRESFHQQGIDSDAKFKTFARGLYAYVWEPSNAPDDVEYWNDHRQIPDDLGLTLDIIDESMLRFGVPRPIAPSVSPELPNDDSHESIMQNYIALTKFVILDNMKFMRGHPYLPEEKAEEYQTLQESLSADERAYCDAVGELELRQSNKAVHNYGCNGCERSPLWGAMYDCLDCGNGNYQLCVDCVFKPTAEHTYPDDNHTVKHNMLRHSVEISLHRATRMRRGINEHLRY